jgi:hypothetical protein
MVPPGPVAVRTTLSPHCTEPVNPGKIAATVIPELLVASVPETSGAPASSAKSYVIEVEDVSALVAQLRVTTVGSAFVQPASSSSSVNEVITGPLMRTVAVLVTAVPLGPVAWSV